MGGSLDVDAQYFQRRGIAPVNDTSHPLSRMGLQVSYTVIEACQERPASLGGALSAPFHAN